MATSETQPDARFRFSLRTLFVLITLVAVCLGVISTPKSMMLIIYTCYLGIATVVAGLVYRRPWLIVLGCLVVAVSTPLHNAWSTWEYNWHGSASHSVQVTVVDAESGQPIPDALITLAHDGTNRYVTLVSGSDGTATFDWPFFTSGKDYVVWKTGCIHVGWEELQIKADGYPLYSLKLNAHIGNELPLDSLISPFAINLTK